MDGMMDSIVGNDQSASQETVPLEPVESERDMCRDVFLTSSIDGTLSLWDRRIDGIVARLAPGPKGTPPWCMSVNLLSPEFLRCRPAGRRMVILSMLDGEMERSMNTPCINQQVLQSGISASQVIPGK
jgi:hypothetical protein